MCRDREESPGNKTQTYPIAEDKPDAAWWKKAAACSGLRPVDPLEPPPKTTSTCGSPTATLADGLGHPLPCTRLGFTVTATVLTVTLRGQSVQAPLGMTAGPSTPRQRIPHSPTTATVALTLVALGAPPRPRNLHSCCRGLPGPAGEAAGAGAAAAEAPRACLPSGWGTKRNKLREGPRRGDGEGAGPHGRYVHLVTP